MTSTPTDRSPSVLRLAGPLIVSFWMRAAVTFIDTVYAALLGDAAVASIGLVVPFEFLMIAIWVGLSTGLTSPLSRAMGARAGAKIDQYLRASWILVWIVGPLLTIVGGLIWLVAPKLGLEPETARGFQIYGTVMVAGSAFTTYWSIIPDSLVKAYHDTRSTMWAGILTNIVNVSLNTFFLFVLHWGLFGIALSTVVARLAGLAYALMRARTHERRRRAEAFDSDELDPHPIRSILVLAIPSSLTFVLMALETGLVNWFLARTRNATAAIAAYSIFYRILLFALQPVIAIAVAMLPFAANRFGSGDVSGVRRGLGQSIVATTIYAIALVTPVTWWLAPWIADQLSESLVTRQYAEFAIRTTPLSCLAGSLFLLCRPVFEAMGRGRPGLVVASFRYLILTAPCVWAGIRVAEGQGYPAIYGIVVGLLLAATLSSIVFTVWTDYELRNCGRAPDSGV
ncbi:MAG: MATE family efflux transporter [Acidobacteriota bacterium]|nr:MATE family efflux transporter [Acidobacteriota bacterium]MDH3786169.1 MATE family efflux transporter [Acidobacteriota bacterium]